MSSRIRMVMGFGAGCLVTIILLSCANRDEREANGVRKAKRKAVVSKELGAPPKMRFIPTPEGMLIELRVPTDSLEIGLVEYQTCYVWRDATTPGTSLSCPNQPIVLPGDEQ